jgi:hypothetical protein
MAIVWRTIGATESERSPVMRRLMKRIVFLLLIGSLAIIRLTAQPPPG